MSRLQALLEATAALLLLALLVVALLGVAARYTGLVFVPWTEELARLLFLWVIWIGAAAATLRAGHIRFDFVLTRLGPSGRRVLEGAVDLGVAAFLVVILARGWEVARAQADTMYLTFPLSVQWSYLSVVAGATLMLLGLALRRLARPGPGPGR